MRNYLLLLLCFTIACSANTKPEKLSVPVQRFTIQSGFVKDSFDIHIALPAGYDTSAKAYPVIYYMDANLKSGKALRNIISAMNVSGKPINAIFVGVGHFSNYRVLRRRDYITPFINDQNDSLISDEKNFGQTENYYQFLKNELIPQIEKTYRSTRHRSYIGHSLGGLFAYYCLFKKDRLFKNYISLSPALWINHYNIYDFEKKYRKDSSSLHATLYMCVGGYERLNKILSGGHMMDKFLKENAYSRLSYTYIEYRGETHNSEVPLALKEILPQLKLD
jgi:uncharacterized protein